MLCSISCVHKLHTCLYEFRSSKIQLLVIPVKSVVKKTNTEPLILNHSINIDKFTRWTGKLSSGHLLDNRFDKFLCLRPARRYADEF